MELLFRFWATTMIALMELIKWLWLFLNLKLPSCIRKLFHLGSIELLQVISGDQWLRSSNITNHVFSVKLYSPILVIHDTSNSKLYIGRLINVLSLLIREYVSCVIWVPRRIINEWGLWGSRICHAVSLSLVRARVIEHCKEWSLFIRLMQAFLVAGERMWLAVYTDVLVARSH